MIKGHTANWASVARDYLVPSASLRSDQEEAVELVPLFARVNTRGRGDSRTGRYRGSGKGREDSDEDEDPLWNWNTAEALPFSGDRMKFG